MSWSFVKDVRVAAWPGIVARALAVGSALGIFVGASAGQSSTYMLEDGGRDANVDAGASFRQVSAPDPGSDEGIIAGARRALAEDRPGAARKILDDWIEAHELVDHPLLAEAYFLRGDSKWAMTEEFNALYDYEAVIKQFPESPYYVKALERETEIASRYLRGLSRRFLGIRLLDASDLGEELLILVQQRLPGSRLGERAMIELADYYYRIRDVESAAIVYDLFLQNYPNSPYRSKAMKRRVYSTIGRFKGPKYDGSVLLDARVLVERYASLYPSEAAEAGLDQAMLTRLDESSGNEMLETARWYMRRDDWVAARLTLKRLLQRYPRTAAGEVGQRMMEDNGWAAPPPVPAVEPALPEAEAPATGADVPEVPATTEPGDEPAPPSSDGRSERGEEQR